MDALIIVDIQNDFVPGGQLAVPDGDAVISVANRVQEAFGLVLATQDWHPADHGSFASNHEGKNPGDIITLNGIEQILWPDHCVQETVGADFVAGFDRSKVEKIFRKGTDPGIDSYSAFYDNGHLKDTGLGGYLNAENVTDVYILGLATDYCVKYTALDARKLGFTTCVVADGCRGVNIDAGDSEKAFGEMKQAGVIVMNSEDILKGHI